MWGFFSFNILILMIEIEVPRNGKVAELKKAVEAAFSHLPCKVSWYVYYYCYYMNDECQIFG